MVIDGGRTCEHCGQKIPATIATGVDWQAFGKTLRIAFAEQNLSLRQAQSATGVDQATLHRVTKHCRPISADNYVLLCAWLSGLNTERTDNG
jgi:hypothetical protein